MIRRSLLPILTLPMLSACVKTLDSDKMGQSIQQDVIRQGGLSLKAVTCPAKIEPEAGKTFECVGEIESGYTFAIPVKQQDDQGHVIWDVPHAKGLLNVAKFENSVQETLQAEIGSRPIIRCGEGFKSIKPGQTFECKVEVRQKPGDSKVPGVTKGATASSPAKKLTAKAAKNLTRDTIVVSIGADGNVTWQRVMPGAISQLLPKPTAAQPAIEKSPNAKSAAQTATSPASPAPPAQKNAEDFLNQPGASAQFED
ncbi:MAG: DUF4333 domain-containing protein [Kovacikia sp.]